MERSSISLSDRLRKLCRKSDRFSYIFMAGTLILAGVLHLGTPLLAALFSYLVLKQLQLSSFGGKLFAVAVFLVLLSAATVSLGIFTNHAVTTLPQIAREAIPSVIRWAETLNVELGFQDYDSLIEAAITEISSQLRYVAGFAKFARGAATQVLFLVAGVVLAISIFLHPRFKLGGQTGPEQDLYSVCANAIRERFATFYQSFRTVMGAQIVISAINTLLTGIFAVVVDLPYAFVIVGVTFLCGLLPVIGNLISNTVIVGIGFTVSPRMALTALVFLVVIHKLEYFLNSKIIGHRIRNPLWLTLVGLLVGERLMGIPGMILAPVVLNYIRLEASQIQAPPDDKSDPSSRGPESG